MSEWPEVCDECGSFYVNDVVPDDQPDVIVFYCMVCGWQVERANDRIRTSDEGAAETPKGVSDE